FSARNAVRSAGMEAMPHLHLATIEHKSDYRRQMSIPYFTTLVGMLYNTYGQGTEGGKIVGCAKNAGSGGLDRHELRAISQVIDPAHGAPLDSGALTLIEMAALPRIGHR